MHIMHIWQLVREIKDYFAKSKIVRLYFEFKINLQKSVKPFFCSKFSHKFALINGEQITGINMGMKCQGN